jgi:hypothetical protein
MNSASFSLAEVVFFVSVERNFLNQALAKLQEVPPLEDIHHQDSCPFPEL